ncbi:vanadium-dependent haloperoxidase [Winogradskyella ursingii]|uniref:vanadium-dependent haloperoxidase n=1 Tax=Winogradskyella ursingii TaxID=2686079 RepID=UPI0015C950F4|nr:vanadium-dependent haloperoxidase [Winogradskyella ursingii]
MKSPKLKIVYPILLVFLVLQSCSNDDASQIDDDTIIQTNRTMELIKDWNTLWLDLDQATNGMRPNSTARALAYIHLAGYETAVADMASYTSNRNRLQGFNINPDERSENVNLDLALNTAYALVFDHFMFYLAPNAQAGISILHNEKETELSTGLSQQEIESSVDWGTYVAQQVIAYSQTDNQAEAQIIDQTPESFVPPVGDGLWEPVDGEVAWFPYWGEVRTFVISPNETLSIAPPFVYSHDEFSDYYAKMNEVNTIATAARLEDNEDLWIAEFWSDDVEGLMMSPPGRQFSIAVQLVEQAELGYEKTLELFLKLGFAMNDGVVSAWADKYTYNTERPSTYIEQHINPDYVTNLARLVAIPNPSFPSYPSGHATFAGAAAGVFIDIFGGDSIHFLESTHEGRTEFRGSSRQFSSFSAMAEENSYSRVLLGVHVQADSDEGLRLGYEVADAINNYNVFE